MLETFQTGSKLTEEQMSNLTTHYPTTKAIRAYVYKTYGIKLCPEKQTESIAKYEEIIKQTMKNETVGGRVYVFHG